MGVFFESTSDGAGSGDGNAVGVTVPVEIKGMLYEIPGNKRTAITYDD